jgi:phage tail sheath protein FI
MASVRLNRTNLDDLYEVDVNPISEFPNVGITIWGQKTLLASNSALDRINVRRLLVDVRRKVRNIANTLLFEPNREETLERFNSLVNPIMQRIQEQSGVDRFKVLIDTTTTTDADVENNTIRGKIFLQPTRSIEFVSLDFVVTNAGSNI